MADILYMYVRTVLTSGWMYIHSSVVLKAQDNLIKIVKYLADFP